MVSNDDFNGKATHLNCFYMHINSEQKYPKPAIVTRVGLNKRARREDFFIYYMKNCEYGGNLSPILHGKLKVWWIFFPKKLCKRACLFIRENIDII